MRPDQRVNGTGSGTTCALIGPMRPRGAAYERSWHVSWGGGGGGARPVPLRPTP